MIKKFIDSIWEVMLAIAEAKAARYNRNPTSFWY